MYRYTLMVNGEAKYTTYDGHNYRGMVCECESERENGNDAVIVTEQWHNEEWVNSKVYEQAGILASECDIAEESYPDEGEVREDYMMEILEHEYALGRTDGFVPPTTNEEAIAIIQLAKTMRRGQ